MLIVRKRKAVRIGNSHGFVIANHKEDIILNKRYDLAIKESDIDGWIKT